MIIGCFPTCKSYSLDWVHGLFTGPDLAMSLYNITTMMSDIYVSAKHIHTGTARRGESDRSIQPQKEDLMHTTVCKGDFRQDSGHLQEGQSTTCVLTEDYTEGSTHKSEETTEAHGQGCGVPDPLCTVQ